METTKSISTVASAEEAGSAGIENQSSWLDHQLQSLPNEKGYIENETLHFYNNFWCPVTALKVILSSQKLRPTFEAQDTDILLASRPKCGTTWLKSLHFTIINRSKYPVITTEHQLHHPLRGALPHRLVPQLEFEILDPEFENHIDITKFPPPRLYATHLPYHAVPDSIKNSGCKIVYVCRNAMDAFVSHWHFSGCKEEETAKDESLLNLEAYVDKFCRGVDDFGPYWVNVLGYWKESIENPKKVLFLRFEELKKDGISEIKKLAEFIGMPFTSEEEEKGMVQAIARFCSLGNLKEFKVNKTGKDTSHVENHKFFRKGEVGDWVNHLNPSQADRLHKVLEEKFLGTGFDLAQ